MTRNQRLFAIGIVTVVIGSLTSLSPARAQGRRGMGQMPMYDTAAETTIKGTITEVKTVTGAMSGMSMQGTHIVLKSDSETIEVHLGPSAFLKEKKVELAAGDSVQIVGSRVKIGEAGAVLAREIQKDGTSWALRDAGGRPLWRMGARR
jgi:hypothetical protein